ncbi:ferredoxin-type protein NapF [Shewanella sp. Scap07]|uniref:ferredoxin-type protein NapF n=1 Tax=Shewanella sp. Scap07 TaxID=2589987 RepID=UPI0015C04635|nr:ferredoxin-type protein NapF [Shewanella sp. Scap07]QLE86028.1 ferredoxin-type protein NapF [Shewanella sp. Scap07]
MSNRINQSRRNLFSRRKSNVIRPPWIKQDIEFTDECTRCDKCISNCETQIIKRGDGGFPEIDFSRDECTFCGKCAESCPEPLFDTHQAQPWTIAAQISDNCLAFNGVWCQSCKDACEPRAITFSPQIGQAPQPIIDIQACTGCGACVAPCPNSAIIVNPDITTK